MLKGLPKNKRWALSVWTGQHMYRRWVFIEGRIGGRKKAAGGYPALYGRSPSVWVGGGMRPLPSALILPTPALSPLGRSAVAAGLGSGRLVVLAYGMGLAHKRAQQVRTRWA